MKKIDYKDFLEWLKSSKINGMSCSEPEWHLNFSTTYPELYKVFEKYCKDNEAFDYETVVNDYNSQIKE